MILRVTPYQQCQCWHCHETNWINRFDNINFPVEENIRCKIKMCFSTRRRQNPRVGTSNRTSWSAPQRTAQCSLLRWLHSARCSSGLQQLRIRVRDCTSWNLFALQCGTVEHNCGYSDDIECDVAEMFACTVYVYLSFWVLYWCVFFKWRVQSVTWLQSMVSPNDSSSPTNLQAFCYQAKCSWFWSSCTIHFPPALPRHFPLKNLAQPVNS